MEIYHDQSYIYVTVEWRTLFGKCLAKAFFLQYRDNTWQPELTRWKYRTEFTNEFGVTTTKNVLVDLPPHITDRLITEYMKP